MNFTEIKIVQIFTVVKGYSNNTIFLFWVLPFILRGSI